MKGILLGLSAVTFFTWCVALGGLAGMQDQCNNGDIAYSRISEHCKRLFSYEWWTISLQFFLLVCTVVAAFMGALYSKFREAILGMTVVVVLLWINLSNKYWRLTDNADISAYFDRVNTFTAGCIMTATIDFLVLMALGWSDK